MEGEKIPEWAAEQAVAFYARAAFGRIPPSDEVARALVAAYARGREDAAKEIGRRAQDAYNNGRPWVALADAEHAIREGRA